MKIKEEINIMGKSILIKDLVLEASNYLVIHSYSKSAKDHYKRIWIQFEKYAKESEVTLYSTELGNDFFIKIAGTIINDKLNKTQRYIYRALKVLDDIFYDREVKKKYSYNPIWIPIKYKEYLEQYKQFLTVKNQKIRTIETKTSRVLIFLRFLDENHQELENLDFSIIVAFYNFISKQYSSITQSNIKFTLRDFLLFLENIDLVSKKIHLKLGSIHTNKHDRLPTTYTTNQIKKTLDSIDRTTLIGKRDYAILLLIMQLGIRSSDICYLKLNSLDFVNKWIVFKQRKTSSILKLPMTEMLKLTLADYIQNSRPESNSEFVFIHFGAHQSVTYSEATIYYILNKYMKKADINIVGKRHGPHSMRHTLSSTLLKEGISLPVISKVLGHSSSEITTKYLWMNTEQLRMLSLEVPYEK